MGEIMSRLPAWALHLLYSGIAILAASLIGRCAVFLIDKRLAAWAARTRWKWDELVVAALRRGVPTWSILLGVQAALAIWDLPPAWEQGLHRAVIVGLWLSVLFLSVNLAGRLVALYGSQFQHAMPVTSLTENIARITVAVLGVLMILHGMGVSIVPVLTALGVGGLAVALALQDTLSNLFSGFYLTVARHLRIGDYVKLDSGQEGYVEDIGWRATKLRTLPNNLVLVPNNKLSQSIITNYELPSREVAVLVEAGVDYDSDLARVEQVTVEVAQEVMRMVPGGVPGFEPMVRYHTFGESSIRFTVVLQGKEFVDQYLIIHEFIKRVRARYRQEGIVMPFPIRTVRVSRSRSLPAGGA